MPTTMIRELTSMIRRLLEFSIQRRWIVVLIFLAVAIFGAWSFVRLPIDAVPDITNNQVQINTIAPALSPLEVEKQVTFRIETVLAGIPGLEYTRSFHAMDFPRSRRCSATRQTSISRASRLASVCSKCGQSFPPVPS